MLVDTKFDPFTVKVSAALPARTDAGVNDAIAGAGLLMVNVEAVDVPPPGVGFTTVTCAVPALARSAAVIAACNCVELTKVVARALWFHCTVEV